MRPGCACCRPAVAALEHAVLQQLACSWYWNRKMLPSPFRRGGFHQEIEGDGGGRANGRGGEGLGRGGGSSGEGLGGRGGGRGLGGGGGDLLGGGDRGGGLGGARSLSDCRRNLAGGGGRGGAPLVVAAARHTNSSKRAMTIVLRCPSGPLRAQHEACRCPKAANQQRLLIFKPLSACSLGLVDRKAAVHVGRLAGLDNRWGTACPPDQTGQYVWLTKLDCCAAVRSRICML